MQTTNYYQSMAVLASVALNADSVLFKGISLAGAVTADADLLAGFLHSKGDSGQGVEVVYQGIYLVDMAAACSTLGFPLKLTTSGWCTVAASGDYGVIGRALATCSSGDRVKAFVDVLKTGYFNGGV
jgi:hypothetical protein